MLFMVAVKLQNERAFNLSTVKFKLERGKYQFYVILFFATRK